VKSAEEVHTALRVDQSPVEWALVIGEPPSAIATSENLLRYVEDLNEATCRAVPGTADRERCRRNFSLSC
jgi:hypothetical protein